MKIICLIKFVPDVENFKYDYERNILVRENQRMVINPEDACALALALRIKERLPDTVIEIVSMAPQSALPLLEDLLRRNADHGTLISDRLYAGSDTYLTSSILARYLEDKDFDFIVSGSHTIDGDTAHVPSQLADLFGYSQLSNIVKVYEECLGNDMDTVIVEVDQESHISKYEMALPCILSIGKESKYKLPFVRFQDLDKDVRDRISIITNEELMIPASEVGIEGSLTRVNRTYAKELHQKEKSIVRNDEDGIKTVYEFLRSKGFVS